MWLAVLKKIYEAEQSEASAVIDTFLQKSVGVADHDNFVKTLGSFAKNDLQKIFAHHLT